MSVQSNGSEACSPKRKPLIGIIGGVGSGKSTVAEEFRKLGCAVIHADELAHAVLQEPDVRKQVIDSFGPGVVDDRGGIDRKKLAQIVFTDGRLLSSLNAIVHPRVFARTRALIADYSKQDFVPAIILDMPLLVEVGWADCCDKILFVDCAPARRVERTRERGVSSERDIKIRENFQISLDAKTQLADNVIDNNSDFSTLVRQIKTIFSGIVKK